MTRRWPACLAFVLAPSPAPALAALLPVSATLGLVMRNGHLWVPPPPPITFTIATGSGYGSSVGGGVATIPAGLFAGNAAVSIPISPTLFGASRLTVPANSLDNATASFGPNGPLGLEGAVFFWGWGGGVVPLAPVGGGVDDGFAIGPLTGTLRGATWMGGTSVFTAMGVALAMPSSIGVTSYDNRTSGGAGSLQLVAPARATGGFFGYLPVFGILTLTYTPEPGTLTLLGAGVAALAMIGRRKLEERG